MEEAEQHLLLGQAQGIPVTCPVRLVHGVADVLVPFSIALSVLHQLQAKDTKLLLVKVCSSH